MTSTASTQPNLLEVPPPPGIFVNTRCTIYVEAEMCVVVVDGKPVFRYAQPDWSAEAMFIAQAQEAGYANARELAAALGKSERTMFRIKQRFLAEGARGHGAEEARPEGTPVRP